jgi:hypothetical protein
MHTQDKTSLARRAALGRSGH